jgi:alpha-D-ribose 1-methylphosphonate 5-triphosphate synthase subunit PhnH
MQAGYADPVADSQRTFRAVLDAVAHPGRVVSTGESLIPPGPLAPAAAAIALTLFDFETPVWVDEAVGVEAREWLRFHTGALITDDPASAGFALVTDARLLPALGTLDCGTDERPERSATLVIQVDELVTGTGYRLTGPGIETEERLAVHGLPDPFWRELRENHGLFPRGVDVLLVAGSRLSALPRTTRVED